MEAFLLIVSTIWTGTFALSDGITMEMQAHYIVFPLNK